MKAYITKYCLTKGIQEVEGERSDHCPEIFNCAAPEGTYTVGFYGEGKQWHIYRASAVERALLLRHRKINRLREQIRKLEALTF